MIADPRFLSGLRSILVSDSLVETQEELGAYECDGLSAHLTTPMLVDLPETVEQVRQILKLCYQQISPV